MTNSLAVFEGREIRKVQHNGQWYFSVVDVIAVLTESTLARRYWSDLKSQLIADGFEVYEKIVQLKLLSRDGKRYESDCADTESMFRIIQSIPSPKAEPFKRWLAQVGYERVKEIENPELAQQRTKEIYRAKGYSEEWIEKRIRGIAIREELTDEWVNREVDGKAFAILTNEIAKATFGKTVEEYKCFKGLKRQNLRDHMNEMELLFNILGEKVTTEVTKIREARGFEKCRHAAKDGGEVAGNARRDTEKRMGRSILTKENYLQEPEKTKREKLAKS